MFSCLNETKQEAANGRHCPVPLFPFSSRPPPSKPQAFPTCSLRWSPLACGRPLGAWACTLLPVLEAHLWWGLADWVWRRRFMVTEHFVRFPPLQRGKLRSKFIKERASFQQHDKGWGARTRATRWDVGGVQQRGMPPPISPRFPGRDMGSPNTYGTRI